MGATEMDLLRTLTIENQVGEGFSEEPPIDCIFIGLGLRTCRQLSPILKQRWKTRSFAIGSDWVRMLHYSIGDWEENFVFAFEECRNGRPADLKQEKCSPFIFDRLQINHGCLGTKLRRTSERLNE